MVQFKRTAANLTRIDETYMDDVGGTGMHSKKQSITQLNESSAVPDTINGTSAKGLTSHDQSVMQPRITGFADNTTPVEIKKKERSQKRSGLPSSVSTIEA